MLGLVLAESLLLLLIGGTIGLLLVSVLAPAITQASGRTLNLPSVGLHSWALGIALMLAIGLVIGALPALRAMRLKIVDALAGR